MTPINSDDRRADSATLEHLVRQAEGGKDEDENLAACCYACNSGRGAVSDSAYKKIRMLLLPYWGACTFAEGHAMKILNAIKLLYGSVHRRATD